MYFSEDNSIKKTTTHFSQIILCFTSIKDFSKNLTRTYDGWSHRELPNMIAILIVDGVLSKVHIADFTPDGEEKMAAMVQRIRNFRDL